MIYQHAAERRDAEVAARLGRLAAGHDPEPHGHVAGTQADGGAGRPSTELFG